MIITNPLSMPQAPPTSPPRPMSTFQTPRHLACLLSLYLANRFFLMARHHWAPGSEGFSDCQQAILLKRSFLSAKKLSLISTFNKRLWPSPTSTSILRFSLGSMKDSTFHSRSIEGASLFQNEEHSVHRVPPSSIGSETLSTSICAQTLSGRPPFKACALGIYGPKTG